MHTAKSRKALLNTSVTSSVTSSVTPDITRTITTSATTLIAGMLLSSAAWAATELTVYTAFETEYLADFKRGFEQSTPGVKIKWVRDSTGVVTAKLLAEKNNPQADVVWGLAATSLLVMDQQGMLYPYAPKDVDKLNPAFRDSRDIPHWIGLDAFLGNICFNTVEAKKHNLPRPTHWRDLTKPVYKGHVIMSNPNSSGTGFLNVAGWMQGMGETQGWEFMDGLHQNVSRYTHSGSAPCKLAASGETVVGISMAYTGVMLKKKGAPIDVILPQEGVGWDMEAAAIIRGTDKLPAAKKLLDYAASVDANRMYNQNYAITAISEVAKPVQYYPANATQAMVEMDLPAVAAGRAEVLAEWSSRYDGKSDKR